MILQATLRALAGTVALRGPLLRMHEFVYPLLREFPRSGFIMTFSPLMSALFAGGLATKQG